MIRSMTGYGRGENTELERKFSVEIKSVNHRYNDLNIKLPRSMNHMEDRIRKIFSEHISRGKVDVYIYFESHSADDVKISLNESLVSAYVEVLKKLECDYGVSGQDKLSLVAKMPEVITIEKQPASDEIIWNIFHKALIQALNEFKAMRLREGQALMADIELKLHNINDIVDKIKLRYPDVIAEYREKLKLKVSEILESKDVDESRILMEVTLFADRSDIDEELTRLKSHIDQTRQILKEENAVGRKLDFIVQEMNREANTITSKSNDIIVTQFCIDLKSEIEKIREQVQNIE